MTDVDHSREMRASESDGPTRMTSDGNRPRYVVVSPVKNEEKYVELTLRAMVQQTVQPVVWVVVDDGSTDGTAEIVRRYAAEHDFIVLVDHPSSGARATGSPVVRAFNFGRSQIGDVPYDYIVKLDCDLSFPANYFAALLERFEADARLGIASGIYLEETDSGEWHTIGMPAYHAFGASKVVRRDCFDEIGGFPTAPGWDTVDEIKAMTRGWRTTHFSDLPVKHHKREGSGIGPLRTNRMHGEIFYTTGGDPLFFLLKAVHRISARPYVLAAAALVRGYMSAVVRRKPRLVTRAERRFYRRLLRRRMLGLTTL